MISIINPKVENKILEAFIPLLPDKATEYPNNWMMLGAVNDEDEALGILAFAEEADGFHITRLYVEEEVRRQGIANMLVSKLLDFVETTGLYMDIEAEFTSEDSGLFEYFMNQPYFNLHEKGRIFSFSADTIKSSLSKLNFGEHGTHNIHCFFEQPSFRQREVLSDLKKQGVFVINDMAEWRNDCCNDLCVCTIASDGKIDSFVFVEDRNDEMLTLSYINASSPAKIIELIGYVFRKYENLDIKKGFVVEPVSEAGNKLMMKILPDSDKCATSYVASWNYISPVEYVFSEENEETFDEEDVVLELVTEDSMVCKGCKYSIGEAGCCKKYEQKPDAIVLGDSCSHYED